MKKQTQGFLAVAAGGVVAVGVLAGSASAFASTTNPTILHSSTASKSTNKGVATSTVATTAEINCVGKVVATRELGFDGSESAYMSAMTAAYSARAKSLAAAYNTGTASGVSSGIKTAWATFDASAKTAQANWATKRLTLWSSFKTAAAACKAPASVIDLAK